MGRRPKARGKNIHGLFILNKPSGLSSNQCLQQVKRLFNANRAGHTGSLDKPATGMLPICLGEATKLSQFLLDAEKEYLAEVRLGVVTTTGDAAGDVTSEQSVPELTSTKIETILKQFRGTISQVPPMYSALKHQGQRLYKLAYQQQEVEREPRTVTIHELELIKLSKQTITLRVACTKGTYIRSLAMEIGEAIGCGGHIKRLHRIRVGSFAENDMIELPTLETTQQPDSLLIPMDRAVAHLPAVELLLDSADFVKQGQAVLVPNSPTQGLVRLYDQAQQFFGIGQILDDGRVAPKRLFHFPDSTV